LNNELKCGRFKTDTVRIDFEITEIIIVSTKEKDGSTDEK